MGESQKQYPQVEGRKKICQREVENFELDQIIHSTLYKLFQVRIARMWDGECAVTYRAIEGKWDLKPIKEEF
jgi:hypothetical protein